MNPLSPPTIKVSQMDNDFNGKIDQFKFKIQFKSDPSKIRQINLLATFDYFVQKKVKMQLTGLLHLSLDTPIGASTVISDGSLVLKQNKPVLIDSIVRSLYDFDPFMDQSISSTSTQQIVSAYGSRNGKF